MAQSIEPKAPIHAAAILDPAADPLNPILLMKCPLLKRIEVNVRVRMIRALRETTLAMARRAT